MDDRRVEELLKLYCSELPEERLLPPDADDRLRARLKRLAGEEEQLFRTIHRPASRHIARKAALALAAAIVVVLTLFFFSEIRVWKAVLVEDRSGLQRGDVTGYYITVKPAYRGFFHILRLDPEGNPGFIFPFLEEEGCDDFGLPGPFPRNVEVIVPPEEYRGYPSSDDLEQLSFFLIPTRNKLSRDDLRAMLDEMKKAIHFEADSLETMRRQTLRWLRSLHSDALVIEF